MSATFPEVRDALYLSSERDGHLVSCTTETRLTTELRTNAKNVEPPPWHSPSFQLPKPSHDTGGRKPMDKALRCGCFLLEKSAASTERKSSQCFLQKATLLGDVQNVFGYHIRGTYPNYVGGGRLLKYRAQFFFNNYNSWKKQCTIKEFTSPHIVALKE